jgi:hypothetical protein
MTEAQVQAMIDAQCLIREPVALRVNSGKVMGVPEGGPTVDGQPITFCG